MIVVYITCFDKHTPKVVALIMVVVYITCFDKHTPKVDAKMQTQSLESRQVCVTTTEF